MVTKTIILLITAVSTSLIGGLLYAYSVSVSPGLGRLTDLAYLSAMQAINKAILNPLFFASFIGTAVLLPVSTYLHYNNSGPSPRFYFLLAASVIYLIGVLGVTIGGNVPLNEWLAKINLSSLDSAEAAKARLRFEGPWNRLHSIRTFSAFLAVVLTICACLMQPAIEK
ncbi:anthrone oxygenase family protein [Dyadobacter arcticus]|uniref:Membrane protein n=1 Tax=Dyadobacter arcticus TaxID=1078754 RepID=A0ABX0UQM1_9BACT|nr:anthrone oxygenase family protein [Dyadobacter arcticus]NIJ54404.1 putative membrane protein [Dyadobacter arcticus]